MWPCHSNNCSQHSSLENLKSKSTLCGMKRGKNIIKQENDYVYLSAMVEMKCMKVGLTYLDSKLRERGNYLIQTYLSFIQHESIEIYKSQRLVILLLFDTAVEFKHPKLV